MRYRRFLTLAGLMAAVFLILYLLLRGQVTEKRQEEETLRVALTRMEENNKEMDARLKLVDTEDYVVNSAMTNYAFMNKNDLRFRFTNPEALYAYTEEELKILMDEDAE